MHLSGKPYHPSLKGIVRDLALRLIPICSPGAKTVVPHYHYPLNVVQNTGTLIDKQTQPVSHLTDKQPQTYRFEITIL